MRIKLGNIGTIVVCVAIGVIMAATIATTAIDEKPKTPVNTAAQTGTVGYMETPDQTNAPPAEQEPETAPAHEEPKQEHVEMLAKLIWGEARGVDSTTEKAAVVWCVLNRVDGTGYACGGDIEWVLTFPEQFQGYSEDYPATAANIEIAKDVLTRWYAEKDGEANVGRVLPKDYIYFEGDGRHNYFTSEYGGKDYWDWSLETPYES